MFKPAEPTEPRKAFSLYLSSPLMTRIRKEADLAGIPVSTAVQTLLEAGIAAMANNNNHTTSNSN